MPLIRAITGGIAVNTALIDLSLLDPRS